MTTRPPAAYRAGILRISGRGGGGGADATGAGGVGADSLGGAGVDEPSGGRFELCTEVDGWGAGAACGAGDGAGVAGVFDGAA